MRNLITRSVSWAQARQAREEGQTIVEYALVLSVVSVIVLAVLATAISGGVSATAGKVTAALM